MSGRIGEGEKNFGVVRDGYRIVWMDGRPVDGFNKCGLDNCVGVNIVTF